MAMTVAVLCGGRSRRMGRDKAALPFGGESMLARAVRTASAVSEDVMVVGLSRMAEVAPARHLSDPGDGPLVALTTALRSAREGEVLLLACDMPLVTPALLRQLHALAGQAEACVPRVDGIAVPTCAIYRRDVVEVAEALVARGERALRSLLDRLSVRWVEESELRTADPDLASFIDCDTPEDYARALAIAGVSDRWN
jgi:molybdopterin-guanine dinucleotide biosynthesis protein A